MNTEVQTYVTWIESASKVFVADRPANTTNAPLRGFRLLVVVNSALLTSQHFLSPSSHPFKVCYGHFWGIISSRFLVSTLELVRGRLNA